METTRLNKFLAHCGIASRRACADLIKAGQVKVDGEVVYDIGYRLNPKQVVTYKGKVVKPEVKKVYILLNKPKNCLTTVKDERGRKTVMDLIPDRIESRIYPVGRLDRDSGGDAPGDADSCPRGAGPDASSSAATSGARSPGEAPLSAATSSSSTRERPARMTWPWLVNRT